MSFADIASAVFWGLIVLSVLVFVHEGGHYFAARAFDIRVTEFFLGMPCRHRLARRSRRFGTLVGVTPILLGGYTRICGMEGNPDELLAKALEAVQERGVVSFTDLATTLGCDEDRAIDLLVTLADWGSIEPVYDADKGEHEGQKTWPESFGTLERDPELRTMYDRGHDFAAAGTTPAGAARPSGMDAEKFLEQERSRTYLGASSPKRVAMLLAGPLVNIALAFVVVTAGVMVQGFEVGVDSNTLGAVTEGSIAQAAGLKAGDTVTSVNGVAVDSWSSLVEQVGACLDEQADFVVAYERDGVSHETTVDLPEGERVSVIGVSSQVVTYHPTLAQAAGYTCRYAALYAEFAVRLITPTHTMEVLDQSSSIVGISVMAADAAKTGVFELVLFAGVISMSLGFMNLLPIPPLDGGKIVIEVIQAVIRRDLSMRAQVIVSYVGIAFFVFVFVVVLKNDLVRLVIG